MHLSMAVMPSISASYVHLEEGYTLVDTQAFCHSQLFLLRHPIVLLSVLTGSRVLLQGLPKVKEVIQCVRNELSPGRSLIRAASAANLSSFSTDVT